MHEHLSPDTRVSNGVHRRETSASPVLGTGPTETDRSDVDARRQIDGVVIGEVTAVGRNGLPIVDFPSNPSGEPLPARTTVALTEEQIGREVVLQFERGDPAKPVVMGLMWKPADERTDIGDDSTKEDGPLEVYADGERVTLRADRKLTLRCGESSITLTRAGKILIRGNYLSSRSTGVNRIKGGSVQIN